MQAQNNFLSEQLKQARVQDAYDEKFDLLKSEFASKKIAFPPKDILFRSFKSEGILEVWVEDNGKFQLFKEYKVCKKSGTLGPKIEEGDLQVPEGFYHIDRFNFQSLFWLSLGINYPNKADKIRSKTKNPGGDIFIHGACVSVGCLPITDDKIKEVYLIAVLAKNEGQINIPVHIYPYKFTTVTNTSYKLLGKYLKFWDILQVEYEYFENNNNIRAFSIDEMGNYNFDF